jgi:ketosteroid isomerase-like protein
LMLLLMALPGAGCAPPPTDLDAAFDELTVAAEGYDRALENLDAAALVDYYAPDAQIYAPDHTVLNRGSVQDFLDERFATPGFALAIVDHPVHISMAGDLGYTTAVVEIRWTEPDGTTVIQKGPDVHVWKKQAAGPWRIIVDIWNSDGTGEPIYRR